MQSSGGGEWVDDERNVSLGFHSFVKQIRTKTQTREYISALARDKRKLGPLDSWRWEGGCKKREQMT